MEQLPITPAEGTQPQASSEAPGMPDIKGMSETELASLLDQVNAGGQPPASPPQPKPQQPAQPQPVQPKGGPDLTNVLNKFGLKPQDIQANPALQKLAQSYYESERNLSGHFQQISDVRKENDELRRIASEYDAYIQQLRTQPQPQGQVPVPNPDNIAWTPQQVEEFNKDPMGFMAKEIRKGVQDGIKTELSKYDEQAQRDRQMDNQIFIATAQARQNLDGFKQLEPQIKQILDQDFIERNPKAIEFAYYTALGKELPKILETAQNAAFQKGYEKHKEEMGRQVENAGKSSLSLDGGQINLQDLKNMSEQELEKIIPKNF